MPGSNAANPPSHEKCNLECSKCVAAFTIWKMYITLTAASKYRQTSRFPMKSDLVPEYPDRELWENHANNAVFNSPRSLDHSREISKDGNPGMFWAHCLPIKM